jgi:hypothetical protein
VKAESIGWRWQKLTGHGWGELLCANADRDGCRIYIYATPKSPENVARSIARTTARCECAKKAKKK